MSENQHDIASDVLQQHWREQQRIDDAILKIAAAAFVFSLGLGELAGTSGWLQAGLVVLAVSFSTMLVSRYVSVECLRDDYTWRTHEDLDRRQRAHDRSGRFDTAVKWLNWVAGGSLLTGALLALVHGITSSS